MSPHLPFEVEWLDTSELERIVSDKATSDALRTSAKMPVRYVGVPDVGAVPNLYDGATPAENTSPGGRAWAKCCDECAFRDLRQHEPIEQACAEQGAAFYCVHREDNEGKFRVCAGFAARDKGHQP